MMVIPQWAGRVACELCSIIETRNRWRFRQYACALLEIVGKDDGGIRANPHIVRISGCQPVSLWQRRVCRSDGSDAKNDREADNSRPGSDHHMLSNRLGFTPSPVSSDLSCQFTKPATVDDLDENFRAKTGSVDSFCNTRAVDREVDSGSGALQVAHRFD